MLTCHDARAVIARTIDDPHLPAEARATLRVHLAGCASCLEEYETQHEVRRLLALHIEEPLSAGFSERLKARLAQEARLAPSIPEEQPSPMLGSVAAAEVESRPVPEWLPASESRPGPASQWNSRLAEPATERAAERAAEPFVEPPARVRAGAGAGAARLRMWLPLLPVAATLALILVDSQLRIATPPPAAAPSSSSTVASAPAEPAEAAPSRDASIRRRPGGSTIANSAARRQGQAATLPSQPLPLVAQSPMSTAQNTEAVAPPPASASADRSAAPVSLFPIVPAPELAEALKLSDRQRKQIDAAIERVLTPDQRRLYRERQANPDGDATTTAAGERVNASERARIRPRQTVPVVTVPVPPPQPTPPPGEWDRR